MLNMLKLAISLSHISISLILIAVVIGAIFPGSLHAIFAIGAIIFSISAHICNISANPALSFLSIFLLLTTVFLGYQGKAEIHIPTAILTAAVSILTHRRAINTLHLKVKVKKLKS